MSSDIYNSFVNAGLTDEKLSTLREIIDNPNYKIEILNAPSTFRNLVNSTIKLIGEIRIKKPPEF